MFSTFFFDYEVAVLFPSFNFWATIIVVIVLSIGPHYLFRGLMGFFFPYVSLDLPRGLHPLTFVFDRFTRLDKDLIREAWVAGDLKDRLGVEHRSKRKHSHVSDIELHPDHLSASQRLRNSVPSESGDSSEHGGTSYRPAPMHSTSAFGQSNGPKSPLKESFSFGPAESVPPINYHYARSTPPPHATQSTDHLQAATRQPSPYYDNTPTREMFVEPPVWDAGSPRHELDPSQDSWRTADETQHAAWGSPLAHTPDEDNDRHRTGYAY